MLPYALRHSARPWRELKVGSEKVEGRTARIRSLPERAEPQGKQLGGALGEGGTRPRRAG